MVVGYLLIHMLTCLGMLVFSYPHPSIIANAIKNQGAIGKQLRNNLPNAMRNQQAIRK